jgi:energy-converting hydrogenase Eha subunit G
VRHLSWGDWLFFGFLVVVSLALWWCTWAYFFVLPRGWPLGLVALGASVLVSVCSVGIMRLTTGQAKRNAEYERKMEELDKERKKLYG